MYIYMCLSVCVDRCVSNVLIYTVTTLIKNVLNGCIGGERGGVSINQTIIEPIPLANTMTDLVISKYRDLIELIIFIASTTAM